jgi:hypothetical protein
MVKVPRDLTQLYQALINISFQGMGNGEGSRLRLFIHMKSFGSTANVI